MSSIENNTFFILRERVDFANGELQNWADDNFCGKTITWEYSDHLQEGVVLNVVNGAIIVKNSKSRSEVTVKFSNILSICD